MRISIQLQIYSDRKECYPLTHENFIAGPVNIDFLMKCSPVWYFRTRLYVFIKRTISRPANIPGILCFSDFLSSRNIANDKITSLVRLHVRVSFGWTKCFFFGMRELFRFNFLISWLICIVK